MTVMKEFHLTEAFTFDSDFRKAGFAMLPCVSPRRLGFRESGAPYSTEAPAGVTSPPPPRPAAGGHTGNSGSAHDGGRSPASWEFSQITTELPITCCYPVELA